MGLNNSKRWFLDRIGKVVFRNKTTCSCKVCTRIGENGLLLYDEDQALWCYDTDASMGNNIKYFDTKEEVAEYEKSLTNNKMGPTITYNAEDFINFIEQDRRDKVSQNGLELIAKRFRELEKTNKQLSLVYESNQASKDSNNPIVGSSQPKITREQLIPFFREQSRLQNIIFYQNDFDFVDKLLKIINK